MSSLAVTPLSLNQIRNAANVFRLLFGYKEDSWLDIVAVLEELQDYGYTVEICSQTELRDKHGETYPSLKKIRIRNDVYDRACDGYGRDRLTIAHEIAHCFLHRGDKVSFARMENVPAYMNPEWQANAFAGEVLAPYKCVKDMDISAISEHYGVSKQAAIIQKSRVH